MTTSTNQESHALTASARPSLLAHIEAKHDKEAERARLRYERGISSVECRVSIGE